MRRKQVDVLGGSSIFSRRRRGDASLDATARGRRERREGADTTERGSTVVHLLVTSTI
jgi:hypothetical protein